MSETDLENAVRRGLERVSSPMAMLENVRVGTAVGAIMAELKELAQKRLEQLTMMALGRDPE